VRLFAYQVRHSRRIGETCRAKLVNGVGWLEDESVPDAQKLVDGYLVKNEAQYKEVLNLMNKSLVENAENIWNRNGLRKYFWEGFRGSYSGLQRTLHKIKLYRHSTHHLSLDEKHKPTFYDFIDEDLKGCMSFFRRMAIREYILISFGH
jgi:hypothetical protein